jgi:predicted NUDIX family NTP pyrophosphohydrolase
MPRAALAALPVRQTRRMAGKRSAGILLYRRTGGRLEVLLGHMGGPLWSRREEAAWSVPKGEYLADEEPLDAARREFLEELGLPVPDVEVFELGAVRQKSGKVVSMWAGESDLDLSDFAPGTFEMEWPPRSGRIQTFPEIDRAEWLDLDAARVALVAYQREFLDRLVSRVG